MTITKWIFLIAEIAAETIRFPHRMRNKRDRRAHALGGSRIGVLETVLDLMGFTGMQVLPLIYIFSGWPGFADYRLPAWAGWAGTLIMAGALWLLWRAHRDLASNWSPSLELQKQHSLVRTGVYARLRHPIYAAVWLWCLAQPLLIHNWIAGLAGLITFGLVYFTRLPREEKMMLDKFGGEYADYMKKVGGIFPRR